jgi:anti-sigma B factor antagonist
LRTVRPVADDPGVVEGSFRLSVTRPDDGGGSSAIARLAGELDAAHAPTAREELLPLLVPGVTLVLDLAELEFMDSAGLGVLVLALTRARSEGGSLVVANPTRRIHRLLVTSKVADLFTITGLPAEDDEASSGDASGSAVRMPRDPGAVQEIRSLLVGFENLLRWGDLRPEQVTLAYAGDTLADETGDLELAARVRDVLRELDGG